MITGKIGTKIQSVNGLMLLNFTDSQIVFTKALKNVFRTLIFKDKHRLTFPNQIYDYHQIQGQGN